MLIRYFTSSYISQYVFLAILIVILWMPGIAGSAVVPEPSGDEPLYRVLYGIAVSFPKVVLILTAIFIYFQALLINYILVEADVVARNTLLPAFFYVVLTGVFPGLHSLNHVLILNFILLALTNLSCNLYEEQEPYRNVFMMGLLTGIASFVYIPSIILFLFIFSILILMRIGKWREWVIPFTGLALPFLFLFIFYFFSNRMDSFTGYLIQYKLSFRFVSPSFTITEIILYILVGAGLLVAVLNVLFTINSKNIDVRKKTLASFYIFVFLIIMSVFIVSANPTFNFMILPTAAIFSFFFTGIRKTLFYEFWIWAIIITGIIYNYRDLI